MALSSVSAGKSVNSVRNERRRQEDKKRMAYRRAIENYREAQALLEQLDDFPELTSHKPDLHRPWLSAESTRH